VAEPELIKGTVIRRTVFHLVETSVTTPEAEFSYRLQRSCRDPWRGVLARLIKVNVFDRFVQVKFKILFHHKALSNYLLPGAAHRARTTPGFRPAMTAGLF